MAKKKNIGVGSRVQQKKGGKKGTVIATRGDKKWLVKLDSGEEVELTSYELLNLGDEPPNASVAARTTAAITDTISRVTNTAKKSARKKLRRLRNKPSTPPEYSEDNSDESYLTDNDGNYSPDVQFSANNSPLFTPLSNGIIDKETSLVLISFASVVHRLST